MVDQIVASAWREFYKTPSARLGMENRLLVAVTEIRTKAQIDAYAEALKSAI